MRQIGGEQQQAVLLRRKDTTGDGSIRKRNRHHMAEIIFWRLKFQFTTGIFLLGSHIKNSTELSIAMGVRLALGVSTRAWYGVRVNHLYCEHMTVAQCITRLSLRY